MRKFEIDAYGITDAKKVAKKLYNVNVFRNVTKIWKKAGFPSSDKDLKLFAFKLFGTLHVSDVEDVGIIIQIDHGSPDYTKGNGFIIQNNIKTKHYPQRVYEIRIKSNNLLIGQASTKAEATKLARELIRKYNQTIICRLTYMTIGDDIAFEIEANHSKRVKLGHYIVLSNEPLRFVRNDTVVHV